MKYIAGLPSHQKGKIVYDSEGYAHVAITETFVSEVTKNTYTPQVFVKINNKESRDAGGAIGVVEGYFKLKIPKSEQYEKYKGILNNIGGGIEPTRIKR